MDVAVVVEPSPELVGAQSWAGLEPELSKSRCVGLVPARGWVSGVPLAACGLDAVSHTGL